jgi:hypothetical protein
VVAKSGVFGGDAARAAVAVVRMGAKSDYAKFAVALLRQKRRHRRANRQK